MSMGDLKRPEPEEFLRLIQDEETRHVRGKLKIFLGYAAGVGKTFAMLEAAHQRKRQGVDVVVGYVETHKRAETDALIEGLEVVPRRIIEYHGASLSEMDLDAILARKPALVLVDELAHSNAAGSRHEKRYQDVEELLIGGVDVYSTVNIQHFESMNDVVHQITGVTVREKIPDRLMDEADEIEVIDLPPDELIQRLKEGKVYLPEQASRAVERFFRKGNLTALREISLRRAAERVDTQMLSYMREKAIPGPWPARDRLMVCLSSHPLGERLVRAGRRLADDLNAEWTVAFIETPGHIHMPAGNRERIQQNLILAEQLGARVVNLTGTSVADTVLEFARQNNITKVLAGKPLRPRWHEFLRGGSVVDQIIRGSGKIDVFVISEEAGQPISPLPDSLILTRKWRRYLFSILIVAVTTMANFFIFDWLTPINLVMFFLAAVVITAVWFGRGPSILASLLSVLSFDFFFVHPRYTFEVSDSEYVLTFIALMAVGLVISSSASLLRDQVDQLRRRESNERAINLLSKDLTAAVNLASVLKMIVENMEKTFRSDVIVMLPDRKDLNSRAGTNGFELSENEEVVALWAFQNGQEAGRGTETLSAAEIRFLPLMTARGVVGVVGVKTNDSSRMFTMEERGLLGNFSNLSALAIERAIFAEQAAQAETLRSTEQLQSALLNSISHELRTPLASIMGALTSLEDDECGQDSEKLLDCKTRKELIQSAAAQTRQMNRLVGNLLDMTRLQSGAVHLNRSLTDVQDLIGAVLGQMEERLRDRKIVVDMDDNIPPINVDAVLIGQALINLLDNAVKFSPPEGQIFIETQRSGDDIVLSVRDQGPGIPENELARIFEKFYRGSSASHNGGTGLGLSISKGIVEAHQGAIRARNSDNGGLMVEISLPINPPVGEKV